MSKKEAPKFRVTTKNSWYLIKTASLESSYGWGCPVTYQVT
jgi:hypothetical protein